MSQPVVIAEVSRLFGYQCSIIVGRIVAKIRQKRDRLDKSMKLGTVTLLTLLNNFRRVAQKS